MTQEFYGTAQGVLTRTGLGPDDLGLEDGSDPDAALEGFVEELLAEASDLMDRVMKKTYLDGDVPVGLNGIACDAIADSVRVMVQSRQTPVVRIDDFAVKTLASNLLSRDMRDRLKFYAKGGGLGTVEVGDEFLQGTPTELTAAQISMVDFGQDPEQ